MQKAAHLTQELAVGITAAVIVGGGAVGRTVAAGSGCSLHAANPKSRAKAIDKATADLT